MIKGFEKRVFVIWRLGLIFFMLPITGCRKDESPEKSRKEMKPKEGEFWQIEETELGYETLYLFKFIEPVNGNIAYGFHSMYRSSSPRGSIKYVGLEKLLDAVRERPIPCILTLKGDSPSHYFSGVDGLVELSETEIEQLEALLEARKCDYVKLQYSDYFEL